MGDSKFKEDVPNPLQQFWHCVFLGYSCVRERQLGTLKHGLRLGIGAAFRLKRVGNGSLSPSLIVKPHIRTGRKKIMRP